MASGPDEVALDEPVELFEGLYVLLLFVDQVGDVSSPTDGARRWIDPFDPDPHEE
jgi:hypothetical protein